MTALAHTWQLLLVGFAAAVAVANWIYEGRKR